MSWICPICDRELPWKDYRHYCARVSLDSLFEGRSPELVLAFDKILAEVADWPKVLVGVTPNCIVFTRRVGFLIIRPMKKELDIKFYSAAAHPEKPVVKSVAAGKKFENHIRIASLDDIRPGLFVYIRESYELGWSGLAAALPILTNNFRVKKLELVERLVAPGRVACWRDRAYEKYLQALLHPRCGAFTGWFGAAALITQVQPVPVAVLDDKFAAVRPRDEWSWNIEVKRRLS